MVGWREIAASEEEIAKGRDVLFRFYCLHGQSLQQRYATESTGTLTSSFWYIPYHGVYQPCKPEKIVMVFDCSSEF